jgi:hypothetical protein
MCSVAHHLAVKFLAVSIHSPKTQTTSLMIIVVSVKLCFKVSLPHGLIMYLVLTFQAQWFHFPQNPRNSCLRDQLIVFRNTNQFKSPVYALQLCLLFSYTLP